MEKIVVRLKPWFRAPTRRRAWFEFSSSPKLVEVTKEQKKLIEEDNYLIIITKGTAYEQGVKNSKEKKKVEVTKSNKEEIIEKLTSKWLVDWVDFNSEANEKDLLVLLNV